MHLSKTYNWIRFTLIDLLLYLALNCRQEKEKVVFCPPHMSPDAERYF